MRYPFVRRSLVKKLLLAAALVGSFAAAQMDHSSMPGMSNMPSMKALDKASGKTFDSMFMSQMVGHHEVAIIMGAIELAHGQKADVRDMAAKIIKDQTDEIGQMHTWLKAWYGAPGASRAQLKIVMEENDSMLKAMQDAAMGNTDRVFLQQMIPHHQGAIEMAKMALEKAANPRLKVLAQSIIREQQKEINSFNALLKKGY
jgi:uncharacterized protein (DUF305 family)